MEKVPPYRLLPQTDFSFLWQPTGHFSPETPDQIRATFSQLYSQKPDWVEDIIPAFNSILIRLKPESFLLSGTYISAEQITEKLDFWLKKALSNSATSGPHISSETIKIPVCYHPDICPEITAVARQLNLSVDEIIRLHCTAIYKVYFMGFLPGFPYMGNTAPELHIARKSVPDKKVPTGSVALADQFTGIYPTESPGGWQIIGRTPLALIRNSEVTPTLLQPGNQVQFYPISVQEWQHWKS
ncbi:MAG: 5-oxoprolinase subunit PxpB [Cytophagaceae bacterium]